MMTGEGTSEANCRTLKHSSFGIASFVLALITGILFLLLMAFVVLLEVREPGCLDEEGPLILVLGFGAIGSCTMLIAGLGLAIAGLVQKGRHKMFSVLGLVFNASFLLGIISLLIIGIIVE
jgi:hypothetical protein